MIVDEIVSRMNSPVREADGAWSGSIVWDAAFLGFKGHFEGHPVLPGVCQLAAAAQFASAAAGKSLQVAEVLRAKFLSVVLPGEATVFRFSLSDEFLQDVTVAVEGKGVVGKFRLRLEERHG